jgi:hypothetical protein
MPKNKKDNSSSFTTMSKNYRDVIPPLCLARPRENISVVKTKMTTVLITDLHGKYNLLVSLRYWNV